jgi:hypothetical protein
MQLVIDCSVIVRKAALTKQLSLRCCQVISRPKKSYQLARNKSTQSQQSIGQAVGSFSQERANMSSTPQLPFKWPYTAK